ncbi:glycoside hydrolase family 97 C-terminal domain-containing protein [Streptomyces sp. NPDC004546]|uniref:glycoside hydrolase family 97 C-terminal domain-containing protein n=1 Tax=unclassified Streptomyces TaxID=2593676 RepID=UPI0033A5550A
MLIDTHDDVRPFGYERTYPNWISLEGVRGNEHFPTATHNVTLPFTRNIGGPMDYTTCYGQSRDRTTNAHQMAMAAVYYQPLEFLYWYDAPSKYSTPSNWPGLPWFDAIPTVWDQSRTLAGSIGEYIAVARRSGTTWYLGAMTNETARTLSIPLSFLGSGTYTATIYADGTPGSSPYQTPVVVSTQTVTSSTTLSVALAPAGGQRPRPWMARLDAERATGHRPRQGRPGDERRSAGHASADAPGGPALSPAKHHRRRPPATWTQSGNALDRPTTRPRAPDICVQLGKGTASRQVKP